MFQPKYKISPFIAKCLMRIEAVKQSIQSLPITPKVLKTLRETARLYSTHYSTMIEGNQLNPSEVSEVIQKASKIKGRERDSKEVLGYYVALDAVEDLVKKNVAITEKTIRQLHALVMAGGKKRVKPTVYRDGQNVIRDNMTGGIVYLPPEAKDVPALMKDLVLWLEDSRDKVPAPLIAGIAHYQFATIHPYYDGNGRTARLLTTLILHLGGYDLKGLYSLEEYYAKGLLNYYNALDASSSHNYYEGREQADITGWLTYFLKGAVKAFETVETRAKEAQREGKTDRSRSLRELDARQRKAITLFQDKNEIKASEVGELFNLKPRSATALCQKWVQQKFLLISDPSRKARKYRLAKVYRNLVD